MKKILILFILFSFANLVSAQSSDDTGCQSGDCNNGFGVYLYSGGGVYTGYFKDGYRHGFGIFEFQSKDYYAGFWEDGNFHGIGTYLYRSVDAWKYERFTGTWTNHKRMGDGVYWYNDNTTRKGNWSENTYQNSDRKTGCISGSCTDGYGTYVWDDGEVYVGYWANSKRNGKGANYWASGSVFYGEWKDDNKEGEGVYSYSDGTYQVGYWENNSFAGETNIKEGCISGDCYNGTGTYVFKNGNKYVGGFVNGNYQGQGTYYHSNGDVYVGNYYNGQRSGYGVYTFKSGNVYKGNWSNGKYNGVGTLYYTDGRVYTGEFVDNSSHGQGKMTYTNGHVEEGKWENGVFKGADMTKDVPEIAWKSPADKNMTTTNSSTIINLCVNSKSDITDVQVYNNNVLVPSNSLRGFTVVNQNVCKFKIERMIPLSPGENKIKVYVKNQYTGTNSEERTITYSTSVGGAQKRTALLIGNANYAVSPLKNPANDARDMAIALRELGFDVEVYTDLTQNDMKRRIRDFGEKLADSRGVGVFYFAGHGMQVDGQNYLIPINANIQKEQDVELESVNLQRVLGELDFARNELNIVILDACRDNPFAQSFRSSGGKGLASTLAPQGTFIAYATAPGTVAADGSGSNGLYTEALLKALKSPGLKLEDVFKTVRKEVYDRSGQRQVPWENSSIFNDFYFNN